MAIYILESNAVCPFGNVLRNYIEKKKKERLSS